ncbi:MAG: hypothetical protein P1V35_01195 [Planctomycetota bacterium]|nr:hypothetical protein [Planctomycetota bacterium]
MNKVIIIFAAAAAGILLLVGTFVTAAGMLGADLHALPVVGGLFPEPVQQSLDPELNEMNLSVEEQVRSDMRSPEQVVDNSASPLHAFLLPSPWSSDQLEDLEKQLKTRLNALTEREKGLDKRQADLEESQRHLAELQAELESVRNGMIEERDETVALQDEVKREEANAEEKHVAGLKQMASLFAEGDATEMAQMLIDMHAPEDIGLVLSGLPAERVRDLLTGIRATQPDVLSAVTESYKAEVTK